MAALVAAAEPGLMPMAHPRFHGWVMGSSHPVGVAADWLAAAWGQNAAMAASSPAAAAAEAAAGAWLLELLGPAAGGGLRADHRRDHGERHRAGGGARGGAGAGRLGRGGARALRGAGGGGACSGRRRIPASSWGCGCSASGRSGWCASPADREGRMRAEALRAALARVAGPAIVLAQAGHINSGRLRSRSAEIAAAARAKGAWVHVDGAFGLWARASPRLAAAWPTGWRRRTAGRPTGTSGCRCPTTAASVDRARRGGAAAGDEHQRPTTCRASAARDPGDFTPELSRRARGLRALGGDGGARAGGGGRDGGAALPRWRGRSRRGWRRCRGSRC